MGRLLRDRKISSIGVKRTQPQSRQSINKAKTAKRRHALTDKTNNRENNSPEKIILPPSVTTTRSRARSILSSGSENDSPGNFDLRTKVKIQKQATADKFIRGENDLHEKIVRVRRNALADKTNSSENESPAINLNSRRKVKAQEDEELLADKTKVKESNSFTNKPATMKLRQRKNEEPSTENSFCGKLMANDDKCINRRKICSPPTLPKSKTRGFSCVELSANKLSKSFVQLEDISELIKVHDDGKNKSAKKPIYQMISEDDIKTGTDLLPEDKIKLYEYEVDANSPKKVKAKRKRRPRKKKVHISDSDLSDEEGGVKVRSETKRLCTLATSSPVGKKTDEKNNKKTSFANHSHALSPINVSDLPAALTPRNVKFAEDLPSANSTPNTSEKSKKPVPHKSLRFSQKEISSPVAKIMPGRQIKKSIYINPSELVQNRFSPDLSNASELSTKENSAANLLPSPSQSLKQTKINSFFSTSARSENNVSEMTNHNNSGLFDELPSHSNSESMSTTAASAAGQFITMRRKAMYHAKPRISGFERALAPDKPLKPMTVENCFGFDDDSDADDNFIPPSVQYRSLPLSVSVRPGCSTPITAPQPTRIRVRPVTQPVPKKTVKMAASTPQVTNLSPPRAASVLLAACASEHTSHSPPMILSDPETLTPVTFGDEPSNFCKPARRSYQRTPKPKRDYAEVASDDDDEPLVVAKKAKKKGKQYLRKKKQEEDNWASSINRQFEEIDDVALVVE